MANGKNEQIQFTRGDAERLVIVEDGTKDNGAKLDSLISKMDIFVEAHKISHDKLDAIVQTNTRFRRVIRKGFFWLVSTSGGIGIILFIAERSGWLH